MNLSFTNPDAVTSIGNGLATSTYSYDNNGNLTSVGTSTTYAYDYRNRLIQSVTAGATSTYAYDFTGGRVRKTVASTTTFYPSKLYSLTSFTNGATTTATAKDSIFAGDALVSTVNQILVNGTATGTPFTYYDHPDHLGSTNVVSNASGGVTQALDYYPYGSERVSTGIDVSQREYIGEIFDESSQLSYLQARYYEASRGQFLSQDPTFLAIGNPSQLQQLSKQDQTRFLMNPQQLNSYNYAKDNPITNKDPDGNQAVAAMGLGPVLGIEALSGPVGWTAFGLTTVVSGVYLLQSSDWGSRWGGTVRTVDLTRGSGLNQNPMGPEDWDPRNFGKVPTWMKALTVGGFVAGGVEAFGKPIYEMYQSLSNRGPQATQQLNQQFNSSSVQTRVQATQAYNAASGASSPQQQLWVTPNGAVINWNGGVVAAAPQSNSSKK